MADRLDLLVEPSAGAAELSARVRRALEDSAHLKLEIARTPIVPPDTAGRVGMALGAATFFTSPQAASVATMSVAIWPFESGVAVSTAVTASVADCEWLLV